MEERFEALDSVLDDLKRDERRAKRTTKPKAQEGQAMSKLDVDITGSPTEIKMTRVFDAPKRLVLKAMTTPELAKRWLGGKRAVVTDAT